MAQQPRLIGIDRLDRQEQAACLIAVRVLDGVIEGAACCSPGCDQTGSQRQSRHCPRTECSCHHRPPQMLHGRCCGNVRPVHSKCPCCSAGSNLMARAALTPGRGEKCGCERKGGEGVPCPDCSALLRVSVENLDSGITPNTSPVQFRTASVCRVAFGVGGWQAARVRSPSAVRPQQN